MRQEIDRAMRRTRGYWYDDGLTEISAGGLFVALGLLFLAEGFRFIPPGASSLGIIAVVFAGMALARWAVNALKARLVYPRTGYVRYLQPERPRRTRLRAAAMAAGTAGLIVLLVARAPASLTWIPALDGLLIGAFLLYLGSSLGLARFHLLALASVLAGLGASVGGLGDILGTAVYFIATGVALAVSGTASLLLYLRRTEPGGGE